MRRFCRTAFPVFWALAILWAVHHDAYQHGVTDTERSYALQKASFDATMQRAGFCEWPKAFYAEVNCGSLAPDFHKGFSDGSGYGASR